MKAVADHWKHLPFGETVALPYRATFSTEQFETIDEGLIPAVMEDKWFIYMDRMVLSFHRSWTGQAVYRVSFATKEGGYAVSEAVCSAEILINSEPAYQAELLDFLIHNLLLKERKPFPRPAGLKEPLPGAFQHHVAGTGYREKVAVRRPWWKFWA